MMGTQQSTAASQQGGGVGGGKALAWSAEVTWSDDNNTNTGRGGPSTPGRPVAAGDGEWCTRPLDPAPDTGGSKRGGGVLLAWSWASSWR